MSMPLADLLFLAFALSVDAFVVAFSYGLLIKQKRLSNGIKLSLSTGAGQFLMPVLGFLLTGTVHQYIAAWDHWLGFVVFTFLGVNVIREGWNHRNEEEQMPHVTSLTLPTLLAVGIATSIDALVPGGCTASPRSTWKRGPGSSSSAWASKCSATICAEKCSAAHDKNTVPAP